MMGLEQPDTEFQEPATRRFHMEALLLTYNRTCIQSSTQEVAPRSDPIFPLSLVRPHMVLRGFHNGAEMACWLSGRLCRVGELRDEGKCLPRPGRLIGISCHRPQSEQVKSKEEDGQKLTAIQRE